MTSAHTSHPGLIRQKNEDFILSDDDLGIYLLADGMGGHNAGEIASEMAVTIAHSYLAERLPSVSSDDIFTLLSDAMQSAHKDIMAKSRMELSLMGMGTTLVEVIIREKKAFICHAGDSRAYHYRDTLQRLTRDHTVGDHILENDLLPRERIPEKQWHTLTQAVGFDAPPVPDFKRLDLLPGDMLLLCSDGLTDMLKDEEIDKVISEKRYDLNAVATRLIKMALDNGGIDNTSLIVVTI